MLSSSSPPPSKSEKDKMLAGELYNAFDPELVAERQAAKELCFQYNRLSPVQENDERKQILQKLLRVDDAWIESPFHVDYGLHLKLGKNFYANHGCTILDCNRIDIGDNCMLAPHVCISAATHPLEVERRARGEEFTASITIGNNVWIGANATICPGITLGNGVVVGAGAVVTKSFPDNVVIGGVPAKILKKVPGNDNQANAGK
ncbi:maltose O-acetyltransferase [Nitzschia inconspicua]|uniref:Maltose O-acetyltransferase n=1 Tax=Nitzschia inconspicua TaxID=303405 RepID=A0A9K3PEF4_9STRA|nr:maltose O-acetyltransferase [Nitzschia inconspicua]